MLILPLHKPLNWATFPWITALLITLNCVIYFGFQVPSNRKTEAAFAQYYGSELQTLDTKYYNLWQSHPKFQARFDSSPDSPDMALFAMVETRSDPAFLQAMNAGSLVPSHTKDFAHWQQLRAAFLPHWIGAGFTDRWMARAGHFDAVRMLSATFLHADLEHLLGNMVFLLLFGLLVEGGIGRLAYLLLYLLAGMGASLVSALWRMHDFGGGLGASGAIAGLSGALAMLWGMRRVRVFYWLVVIFDYVRVPALLLLPIWLGFELYGMFYQTHAGVGFDAHAGGMMIGALLAFGLRALKRTRDDFFEEAPAPTKDTTGFQLAQAQKAIGQLDFLGAMRLLEPLALTYPQDFDIALFGFRAACFAKHPSAPASARRLLAQNAIDLGGFQQQMQALDWLDTHQHSVTSLSHESQRKLALSAWRFGARDRALQLLAKFSSPDTQSLFAPLAMQFLLSANDTKDSVRAKALAELIIQRFADQPEAKKAMFWRAQWADPA